MPNPKNSWILYLLIAFGIWLLSTPLTFSLHSRPIFWNDIFCGAGLIFLGVYSFWTKTKWPFWSIAAIGIWLQFAPLIFWAKDPLSYLNDTLIGLLVILFALVIPEFLKPHISENPPGWSFNPSAWTQRLPTITLCFICWLLARYMAAFQLGYLDQIWDPVFGNEGTLKVITSPLSKSFPISDAGLGALVYSLEVLLGSMGGTNRWRTMPWIVFIFAIMVVPAGLVSVLLIISQPIIVGHWCTWCLITALCMLFMIALTLDEAVAVIQNLYRQRSQELTIQVEDEIKGISFPKNLVFTFILGLWIMFSPALLKLNETDANLYHIFGALTVTFSVIAFSEAARPLRLLNVLLGLALIWMSSWNIFTLVFAIALITLSLPKGKIHERYGNWDNYIR